MKRKIINILLCFYLILSGCNIGRFSTPVTSLPVVETPTLFQPTELAINNLSNCGDQSLALKPDSITDLSKKVDLTCYQIDVSIEPDTGSYKGQETIIYHNSTGISLSEVVFRLYPNAPVIFGGEIKVDHVSVAGQSASFELFLNDATGLRIFLNVPLAQDETVAITIFFTGKVPAAISSEKFQYGVFYQGDRRDLWVLANFYPILAVFSDQEWQAREVIGIGDPVTSETAFYDVHINLPIGWKLACTGKIITENLITNDWVRYSVVSGPQRDFILIIGKNLTQSSIVTKEGISISHYSTSSRASSNSGIALKVAQQAMDFFVKSFGEYPFTELDIVAVPLQNALGVEFPGLILIQDALYADPNEYDTFAIVIAHEIAHQWWYNQVGNDVYLHPWMDEALATYSSLAYARSVALPFYEGVKEYGQNRVKGEEVKLGQQPITNPLPYYLQSETMYGSIVYQKGALFLDALRVKIGDEAFSKALQDYFLTYRFTIATPKNLLGEFQTACKCDLAAFFQQWNITSR